MMRSKIASALLIATAGLLAGCGTARDATLYRDATRELVMTRNPDVKSCYDAALKAQPTLAGQVVVHFKVLADSGKLTEPTVDQAQTTAPAALSSCIVKAIDGLTLAPGDRNEGLATFRWDLKPGQS